MYANKILIGWVYVDFYLFGFKIYFGTKTTALPATMPEFLNMLDGPAMGSNAKKDTRATTDVKYITVTIQDGAIPELNDSMQNSAEDASDVWHVRAGTFQFRAETKFATSHIDVTSQSTMHSPYPVYSRPMQTKDGDKMYSQLVVSISTQTEPGFGWNVTPIEKQMPSGCWGSCTQDLFRDEVFEKYG